MGNLAAKILWGWALGRWHPRYLWAMCFGLLCIGIVLQLFADALNFLPLMHVAFFLWGLGFGGGVPLGEFIWAKYYGRVHIGAVRSVGMPVGILFGALGPITASLLFDASGTYTSAWLLMLVIYAVGATSVLISREPPPKVTPAEAAAMRASPPAATAVAPVVPAAASPVAAAVPALATTPAASLTHDGLGVLDWNLDGVEADPPVNGAGATGRSAGR